MADSGAAAAFPATTGGRRTAVRRGVAVASVGPRDDGSGPRPAQAPDPVPPPVSGGEPVADPAPTTTPPATQPPVVADTTAGRPAPPAAEEPGAEDWLPEWVGVEDAGLHPVPDVA